MGLCPLLLLLLLLLYRLIACHCLCMKPWLQRLHVCLNSAMQCRQALEQLHTFIHLSTRVGACALCSAGVVYTKDLTKVTSQPNKSSLNSSVVQTTGVDGLEKYQIWLHLVLQWK